MPVQHAHVVPEHLKLWLVVVFQDEWGTVDLSQCLPYRRFHSARCVLHRWFIIERWRLPPPLYSLGFHSEQLLTFTLFIKLPLLSYFGIQADSLGFIFHVEISTEISSFLLYTMNVRGKFNLWCSQDLRDWDNPQNTLSTFFFIESTSCRSPWGNLLVFHFHEIWASRACRWRVVSKSMWQQFWVEADATWNEPAASVLVPRQADVSTEPR